MHDLEETLVYNVMKDFFFPIFLALMSAFVAWYFFFRQILNERKKDEAKKSEDLSNKLTYFAMIVENAIENAQGQNAFLKDMIVEIGQSGVNLISWHKHPTYDLKVISEKLSAEEYLLSYLSYYRDKNKRENLKDFKNIVESCVVINDIFISSAEYLEGKIRFDNELKRDFFDKIAEAADLFGKSIHKMREEENPLFTEMYKIHVRSKSMKEVSGNLLIPTQVNLFALPILQLLDKKQLEGVEFDEYTGNLWVVAGQAVNTYKNLQSDMERLKSTFSYNYSYAERLIARLKDSSEKLRSDFI